MLLLSLLLMLFTLLAVSLEKAYYRVSTKELKRRAREGDAFAAVLYKAVSYGASLYLLLWLLIGLGAGGFFVVISRSASPWLAFAMSVGLVLFGFAWIPNSSASAISSRLAKWLAPFFGWLLNILHPVLNGVDRLLKRIQSPHLHSGLYRKEDLIELLDHQAAQNDNRMTETEIEIARRSLQFGDKIVRDIMVPRRAVKIVNANDAIGPILIDELHKSGHSRFPVYDGKKDNIVGTLYLRDLIGLKVEGSIKDTMYKKAFYVHEEQSLYDVFQAILKTHHQMFVVVNNFEEFVGVIGLEDIVEQIIGTPILDEFDHYEDLRAVAARSAKQEHQEHDEPEKATPDESQVVE